MGYETFSIWRINYIEPSKRSSIHWYGSAAAAHRAASRMRRECEGSITIVTAIDFPARKYTLLKWLNENFI